MRARLCCGLLRTLRGQPQHASAQAAGAPACAHVGWHAAPPAVAAAAAAAVAAARAPALCDVGMVAAHGVPCPAVVAAGGGALHGHAVVGAAGVLCRVEVTGALCHVVANVTLGCVVVKGLLFYP